MYTIAVAMALPIVLTGVPLIRSLFFAPLFLMFFKYMEDKQPLVATRAIKVSMQVAIAIVALWFSVRLFASKIPGGGAGFAVDSYGLITFLPAIGVLLLLDLIVLFRSYGKKIGSVALMVVVVVSAFRLAAPYWNNFRQEPQWQKCCEEAKDEFNMNGENILGIQLYFFIANDKFVKKEDGRISRSGMEYLGDELLKRGSIKEYESIDNSGPQPYRAILKDGVVVKSPITEAKATHKVSYNTKNVPIGASSKRWFTQQDISITNINTGKVVAHRIQYIDYLNKKDQSCAQIYNNQISTVDFIQKAIEKSKGMN